MLFEGMGEPRSSIATSDLPTGTPTQPSVEGSFAVQDYRRRPSIVPGNPGWEERPIQSAGTRRPLTCRRCYHTGTAERPGHVARDCSANYRRDGPKIIKDFEALPNFLKGKVFTELYDRATGRINEGNYLETGRRAEAPAKAADDNLVNSLEVGRAVKAEGKAVSFSDEVEVIEKEPVMPVALTNYKCLGSYAVTPDKAFEVTFVIDSGSGPSCVKPSTVFPKQKFSSGKKPLENFCPLEKKYGYFF